MDTRKKKRFRAPIASFEKSLEDPSGTVVTAGGELGISTTTCIIEDGLQATAATAVDNKAPAPSNCQTMERQDAAATVTQPTNIAKETTAALTRPSRQTMSGGSAASYKRPPPLKATHTTLTTTTLVKSCEQQVSYRGATTLTTPSTPRIELSRASSSSHHEEDEEEIDSRESSPENVFEQVGHGTLQETIGLGFREEGTLELRTSTEELFFMDPEQKKEEQEKLQQQQQQQIQQATKRSSPHIFRFEDHQSYLQHHQRKDSASSEVAALLCISGRTSRISSVGSQGSAVSRLSAVSGVSRSPSPHRMLLETSFCGPKPMENVVVDGRSSTISVEPPASELMEQVLLARKPDPTQAILAEGILVKAASASPKKKPTSLSNGDSNLTVKIINQNKPIVPQMGGQRRSTKSPGQMVVGKTPSGTEYIRINLKPDHMYDDRGMAPNEKVVEAPNTLAPVYSRSQKKPASLSLGRNTADENRLTPTASPKASRQGSRSPSPANVSVSRKSSFSSLFRLGKDSPDSPRERARSRSKSKERQSHQLQNATPSKQKSVLAIFKPGKRGSSSEITEAKSSKTSSPIDGHHDEPSSIHHTRSKSQTPVMTSTGSRPPSRLRYYDEPVEGYIHIPLHTPPDEKEARELLKDIQQLNAEPVRAVPAPITTSQLAAAAAALKPVGSRKGSSGVLAASSGKGSENLNAIHRLSSKDEPTMGHTWNADANLFNSQDSQDTDSSYALAIKMGAYGNLPHLKENVTAIQENGISAEAEVHRLPSVESEASVSEAKVIETVATVTSSQEITHNEAAAMAKERRRLLFATRLGSGSQEQVFSTQFSISKTESQSSQLSDTIQDCSVESEHLHRQITVIRRSVEDDLEKTMKPKSRNSLRMKQKSILPSEDEKSCVIQTTVSAVVMRRKDTVEDVGKRKSFEEDGDTRCPEMSNQRHSRYLENFDVRKKYQDNLPLKSKRESVTEDSELSTPPVSVSHHQHKPTLPHPPPPSTAPSPSPTPSANRSLSQSPIDRETKQTPTKPPRTTTPTGRKQPSPPNSSSLSAVESEQIQGEQIQVPQPSINRPSVNSTDEAVESSESERDSDLTTAIGGLGSTSSTADVKRHHLPRHVDVIEDHESTGLVSQESFDDELPYIPTTLPEERAQGVALVPMKDRANMELKTCPVERPRSTTPLNPSHLEEYYGIASLQEGVTHTDICSSAPVRGEKLRISLPRKDSTKEKAVNSKSPRRISNTSGKSWFEFAEEGLRAVGGNLERKDSSKQLLSGQPQQTNPQPQTPHASDEPKTGITHDMAVTTTTATNSNTIPSPCSGSSTQRKLSGHWIDFENIPEKRKPPKRITTLPKEVSSSCRNYTKKICDSQQTLEHLAIQQHQHRHGHGHGHHHTEAGGEHYNYVKPEDCQCECHEVERDITTTGSSGTTADTDKEQALTTVDLLPQGEDLMPLLDMHDGIELSEYSYYTDDEVDDMPVRHTRSKSSSSKIDEFPRRDVSHNPRSRKFPDNKM